MTGFRPNRPEGAGVDSTVFSVVLPIVLALVMFGLGLSLTVADFARVLTAPRAVAVALLCQVVLLPAVCLGLVLAFGLTPELAIGMMVLAAAPGGAMANVFSHLAGGDVAFNITLTAVNSLLSIVTLPLVTVAALRFFAGAEAALVLQPDKLVQVLLVVLLPAAAGMLVRRARPRLAARLDRPVRVASVVAVFLAIVAAILPSLNGFLAGLAAVGLVCVLFSAASLTLGYAIPRLLKVAPRQAVAASMEIGIHNAVLAITVAVTVLEMPRAAIAPAMYGAIMFFPAALAARILARRLRAASVTVPAPS